MEPELSRRHISLFLFSLLVLCPPWLDEKYNIPLSPAVRKFILTTCHNAEEWGFTCLGAESLLPALLSMLLRPVDLFYPGTIQRIKDWASFWYWYYVEDVATEDPLLGWSVCGRSRLILALGLFLRSLLAKMGTWKKSRYSLGEESLCRTGDSEEKFNYTPLEASHFRLLRLYAPQSQNEVPNCELFALPMADATSTNIVYKCLSYRWGSEDKSHSIMLNKRLFNVSQSLWEFLNVYQRRSDNDTYLWIDQICINQVDVTEKNYQVSRMDMIYKQCEAVVVWLGTCSDSSTGRALHFLHAIQSPRGSAFRAHNLGCCFCLEESKCLIKWSALDTNRQPDPALQALLSNPYWSRAWIVQEMILAPCAKIVCGSYSIDYVVEKEGLLHHEYSREGCRFREETQHFFNLMYAHSQVKSRYPWQRQGLWCLQEVMTFVQGETRDVRDKIFALQGLVRPEQKIQIDYNFTKEEVFRNVLITLFNHYHESGMRGSAEEQNFAESIGYLLDEFGLPDGLEKVFYSAETITWCLRTSSSARRGTAFYARGEKHSFQSMSMVQIVEYFYNVADNLENPRTREWLASQGVIAKPNQHYTLYTPKLIIIRSD
jgi:hypothetical protein